MKCWECENLQRADKVVKKGLPPDIDWWCEQHEMEVWNPNDAYCEYHTKYGKKK